MDFMLHEIGDFGPCKAESRAKVRFSAVIQLCSCSDPASKALHVSLTILYTFDKMIGVF